MDFHFSKEEEMFRDQVRKFAQKELPPLVPRMENNEMPDEIRKKMADMGIYGIIFPREYGGLDGSYLLFVLALEEIAKILPALAIPFPCKYGSALISSMALFPKYTARAPRTILKGDTEMAIIPIIRDVRALLDWPLE